ncbi:MAG: response regulator, partial [Polyangiaceae bacterium]|nr:response regulator [Polyangiaceae bacterium]
HLPLAALTEAQREIAVRLHSSGQVLAGRTALVVDDDIRNIFAMTTMLEEHEMFAIAAETGREALAILDRGDDVDVVLMDIMMPEMDGYDTMRAIRERPRFQSLPIIAVTARAMRGDREKCFEAGASDYLAKPVDPEQLRSALTLWLGH